MGAVLQFLGNVVLTVVLSLVAAMIDHRIQSRKKEKSQTSQSRSS